MTVTKKQQEAFERGRTLLEYYTEISKEHADPTINKSVIAGDMIADILYTMHHAYEYPEADVESVKIMALESIRFDHTK